MIGIYKWTNLIDGKVYIGQSKDIESRKKGHLKTLVSQNRQDYDYPLYRAMRKYGINNFKFEIIEECLTIELNDKEILYIREYNSIVPNGYNQTLGGNYASFVKLNPQLVEEITLDLKNTTLSGIVIAERYGISDQMVSDINVGVSWIRDIEYPIRKNYRSKEQINKDSTCPNCGNVKTDSAIYCKACASSKRRVAERPDRDMLLEEIALNNFTQVAAKYNVSRASISRWCKSYGLPTEIKDIKELYNTEKDIIPDHKFFRHDANSEKIKMSFNKYERIFNSVNECAEFLIKKEHSKTNLTATRKGIMRALRKERLTYLNLVFDYIEE